MDSNSARVPPTRAQLKRHTEAAQAQDQSNATEQTSQALARLHHLQGTLPSRGFESVGGPHCYLNSLLISLVCTSAGYDALVGTRGKTGAIGALETSARALLESSNNPSQRIQVSRTVLGVIEGEFNLEAQQDPGEVRDYLARVIEAEKHVDSSRSPLFENMRIYGKTKLTCANVGCTAVLEEEDFDESCLSVPVCSTVGQSIDSRLRRGCTLRKSCSSCDGNGGREELNPTMPPKVLQVYFVPFDDSDGFERVYSDNVLIEETVSFGSPGRKQVYRHSGGIIHLDSTKKEGQLGLEGHYVSYLVRSDNVISLFDDGAFREDFESLDRCRRSLSERYGERAEVRWVIYEAAANLCLENDSRSIGSPSTSLPPQSSNIEPNFGGGARGRGGGSHVASWESVSNNGSPSGCLTFYGTTAPTLAETRSKSTRLEDSSKSATPTSNSRSTDASPPEDDDVAMMNNDTADIDASSVWKGKSGKNPSSITSSSSSTGSEPAVAPGSSIVTPPFSGTSNLQTLLGTSSAKEVQESLRALARMVEATMQARENLEYRLGGIQLKFQDEKIKDCTVGELLKLEEDQYKNLTDVNLSASFLPLMSMYLGVPIVLHRANQPSTPFNFDRKYLRKEERAWLESLGPSPWRNCQLNQCSDLIIPDEQVDAFSAYTSSRTHPSITASHNIRLFTLSSIKDFARIRTSHLDFSR
ncbi:hypothetical protein JCM5350_005463 [Sporobolomyces pararoseus]